MDIYVKNRRTRDFSLVLSATDFSVLSSDKQRSVLDRAVRLDELTLVVGPAVGLRQTANHDVVVVVLRIPDAVHDAVTRTSTNARRQRVWVDDLLELDRDVWAIDYAVVRRMCALVSHDDVVASRIDVADEELLTIVDETNLRERTNSAVRNRRSVLAVLERDELIAAHLLEESANTR